MKFLGTIPEAPHQLDSYQTPTHNIKCRVSLLGSVYLLLRRNDRLQLVLRTPFLKVLCPSDEHLADQTTCLFYLKAGDGAFSSLFEGFIDPHHDGVISYFLSIAEVLQDVQGVPEEDSQFQTQFLL